MFISVGVGRRNIKIVIEICSYRYSPPPFGLGIKWFGGKTIIGMFFFLAIGVLGYPPPGLGSSWFKD